ncbi:ECF transporter S component [Floricoccus penangensis]|uniref:ECF transporter S component n=1 Tax=Floricoccus penangensis TaxID=1859475 RepID=UPI00204092AE|nr:ECF transporter S component [Floricoccus penangensis]URZ87373.1 ECF transporter S component [Floricoccus penangensis]
MRDRRIQDIVLVALFAALTAVATTIKIPMPTGAFVHLGNSVLLLSVLLLGYVKGSLAGGLGFAIFDILNGYASEAPYFILEAFIVGGAAYLAFLYFKKNPTNVGQLVIIGIVTGIAKVGMTFLKNFVTQLYLGQSTGAAAGLAVAKLPATLINVSVTILVVAVLYFPLRNALEKVVPQVVPS